MTRAIDLVMAAILFLCTLVVQAIGFVDGVLGTLMTRMAINPQAQIALLIGISLILVVAAIRRLGRIFAALIIVLLVLLLLHKQMPDTGPPLLRAPPSLPGFNPPPATAPPGVVHA